MSLPDNLLLSLSATIRHPWDFTFYARNGEIANRIRAEFQAKLPKALKDIRIDADNDIAVSAGPTNFYVNPSGVVSGGWLLFLRELSNADQIAEYSRCIDLLLSASTSFMPEAYSIRLLFRTTPENAPSLLRPQFVDGALATIAPADLPTQLTSFKTSMSYGRGIFSDSLEVEVSESEVQLRYHRASSQSFVSFEVFLQSADLKDIVGEVAAFVEFLKDHEPQSPFKKPTKQ